MVYICINLVVLEDLHRNLLYPVLSFESNTSNVSQIKRGLGKSNGGSVYVQMRHPTFGK